MNWIIYPFIAVTLLQATWDALLRGLLLSHMISLPQFLNLIGYAP